MAPESAGKIHPRELELAKELKKHEIEWDVITGDWFSVGDTLHFVMRVERDGDKTVLYGVGDNPYDKEDVIFVPHASQCREWLMNNDWDIHEENLPGGAHKVSACRRQTDFHVEKSEPTEMAALYAVMAEVLDLVHFGWV
jgi:hypothetical protein